MPYYIFCQKTFAVQGGPAAIAGFPDGMNPLDWLAGTEMVSPSGDEPFTFDLSEESGSFRGAIIDGFVTLYHRRLCAALSDFGVENIQYFPALLRNPATGTTEDDYRLVNIVGRMDCVDMERSKVKWWDSGMGFNFLSMAIDKSKTHGLPIFRLESDPTKVLISEALKRHLEMKKVMVGVKVISPEDYSDF